MSAAVTFEVLTGQYSNVTAQLTVPNNAVAVISFAHGAGTDMHHSFMAGMDGMLIARGIGVCRFNFPYTELKKRRPDTPAVAMATVGAVLQEIKNRSSLPLFAGGKSFGGRMTSNYLASHPDGGVRGVVFYGFPLHPAGSPGIVRAEHLQHVQLPMLFIQGTKDALAERDLLTGVLKALPLATYAAVEGADHGFLLKKQVPLGLLADLTSQWIRRQLGAA